MQLAVELDTRLYVAWGRDTTSANMPLSVYRIKLANDEIVQMLHQVGAKMKPFKLHGFKSKVVEKEGGEKEAVETEEPYGLWVELEQPEQLLPLKWVRIRIYDEDDANESTVSKTNQAYANQSED
eukprot:Selendium_serpulae@DN4916_c0_g1_i1.p1